MAWSFATKRANEVMWQSSHHQWDTAEEAANAAMRWLLVSASCQIEVCVKLEKRATEAQAQRPLDTSQPRSKGAQTTHRNTHTRTRSRGASNKQTTAPNAHLIDVMVKP